MLLDSINFTGVGIAAIAAMAIGAFWYSPVAFGQAWMTALGKTAEDLGKPVVAIINSMIQMVIISVMIGVVLAWVDLNGSSLNAVNGAIVGFMLWFGFVFSIEMVRDRFTGAKWKLTFINLGHGLAVYLAIGAIQGALA